MQGEVITLFYQAPEHTKAWGENIRKHLPEQWDHLLFSYHGLPERHLTKADPTRSALPKAKQLLQCGLCGAQNLLPTSGDGHFTRNRPISRH